MHEKIYTPSSDEWKFDNQRDLRVRMFLTRDDLAVEIPFENGILIGRLDFQPGGANDLISGELTQNLLAAFISLQEFFKEIDSGGKPEPMYLYGVSNLAMATISRRLGFKSIKQYTKLRGRTYVIVGETKVIRQKLQELFESTDRKGRKIIDLLEARTVTNSLRDHSNKASE